MRPIDGTRLSIESFAEVAIDAQPCTLSEAARERMGASRAAVERLLESGEAIYGVNTGFGDLAGVRIAPDSTRTLQKRLLLSHAAGVGEPLSDDAVRGMLLLRANTLALGYSGIRAKVVDLILEMLNRSVLPVVPRQGSVGASGDLAPLAHLALPLIGGGRVRVGGREVDGATGLAEAGLEPVVLEAKEGLALIDGTQASTALTALHAIEVGRWLRGADLIAALSVDAFRGTDCAFESRVHELRPHPGQIQSARNLWTLLQGSEIRESHRSDDVRIQDPYSFRCSPQVHGAVRDVWSDVCRRLTIEMNSVTDNPLVFGEPDEMVSGGNFHAEPVALAADFLAIATAELGAISERRIEKLTNAHFSGLPPFLVEDAGVNSGFMILQVTAAALASENKVLAHPASVDSITTSAEKEDHVSMSMGAALKLGLVVENVRRILAIELMSAAQGIDLLRPLRSSEALERFHADFRGHVSVWKEDREAAPDVVATLEFLRGKGLDPHLEQLV